MNKVKGMVVAMETSATDNTGRIFVVYIYDENLRTCCCEAKPSYYLVPCDVFTEYSISESEKDILIESYLYDSEPSYFHCSIIDNIPKESDGMTLKYYLGEFDTFTDAECEFFDNTSVMG